MDDTALDTPLGRHCMLPLRASLSVEPAERGGSGGHLPVDLDVVTAQPLGAAADPRFWRSMDLPCASRRAVSPGGVGALLRVVKVSAEARTAATARWLSPCRNCITNGDGAATALEAPIDTTLLSGFLIVDSAVSCPLETGGLTVVGAPAFAEGCRRSDGGAADRLLASASASAALLAAKPGIHPVFAGSNRESMLPVRGTLLVDGLYLSLPAARMPPAAPVLQLACTATAASSTETRRKRMDDDEASGKAEASLLMSTPLASD